MADIPAACERPEPLKFAWPLMLLPDLFTTARHLAVARGYFASIGWEVYAPDLRAGRKRSRTDARASNSSAGGFDGLAAMLAEALTALGHDAIVVGHGLGGLLALNAVEASAGAGGGRTGADASRVSIASGDWVRRTWPARLLGRALKPPRGAVLFHLLADAEPFQREALTRALVADDTRAALEVVRGRINFAIKAAAPCHG